jgi:hypothetical protein
LRVHERNDKESQQFNCIANWEPANDICFRPEGGGIGSEMRLIRFSGRLPLVDPLSFFVLLLKEKRLCPLNPVCTNNRRSA